MDTFQEFYAKNESQNLLERYKKLKHFKFMKSSAGGDM